MWNPAQSFGANNVDNNTAFTKPMAQFIRDCDSPIGRFLFLDNTDYRCLRQGVSFETEKGKGQRYVWDSYAWKWGKMLKSSCQCNNPEVTTRPNLQNLDQTFLSPSLVHTIFLETPALTTPSDLIWWWEQPGLKGFQLRTQNLDSSNFWRRHWIVYISLPANRRTSNSAISFWTWVFTLLGTTAFSPA